MTTLSKEDGRIVERKMKSQGGEAATSFSHSLRRDTGTVQETLYVLHKLFLKKKEDGSPFNREAAELLELAQEQAEVAEDDLVRTSFHNAELQMLLTDEKLQADDAKVQHERERSQAHADLEM
ncbi:uncharacterized protein LOC144869316 isoform X2 [Branchiostoma floridae x Branchiostoma japonicum]